MASLITGLRIAATRGPQTTLYTSNYCVVLFILCDGVYVVVAVVVVVVAVVVVIVFECCRELMTSTRMEQQELFRLMVVGA